MLTRQEAALQRQREREAQEWREQLARLRQEEEQARREPRRDGRYVVIRAPSMSDPVPPPEEDIFWRQGLEASYEFPDQDVAMIGDDWRGTIRRLQGLRHGPRTPRFRRQNFDSMVPVVVVVAVVAPRRRRYRSINAIMDAQAAESDDDSQGSEEQQVEDIGEGVALGQEWQEEVVFKGAQEHGWWQDEVVFKGAHDHGGWQDEVVFKGAHDHGGWQDEIAFKGAQEVGWQEMQADQEDAGPHQAAEDDQSLEYIDTNVFLNLSDDE